MTGTAGAGAMVLGFDERDIVACVLSLTMDDFHKSMHAVRRRGLWQDVYRPIYCGLSLYVKVQIVAGSNGATAVVISFKRR